MKLVTKIFKRNDWYITSPFGKRNPIKTNTGITSSFHNGCDYGTNCEKWPQYGIEKGQVISVGRDGDGANYVWVKYSRLNIKLLHYHLDSVCVKNGQIIDDNTILGYTGKTGMATNIHLHLGMKYLNSVTYVDPHAYDYQEKVEENIDEIIYTVVKGDTLSKIATKYGTNYKALAVYNKINNPNLIHIGDKIKIPSNNEKSKIIYIVKRGDTLSKIASKYGMTWQELLTKNKNLIGDNPNIIYPGQIFIIKN
jgi:murein DD-endopeptidase MepM/ murein hydrolase activator NlpD